MSANTWKPIEGLDGQFFLEGLHDDYEGLRLFLKNKENEGILLIVFEKFLSYRNVDEGDLLKSSDIIKGGFYAFDKSSYLDWFHDESFSSWWDKGVVHYGIYTPNDCIDILSIKEPHFEWLKK